MRHIFGNGDLALEEKAHIFGIIGKKMLTLLMDQQETDLTFYNNAASLNNIYRFIKEYNFYHGNLSSSSMDKAAFFPGTFDPFSLSHKAIVRKIRDMGFEVYMALDEFSWSKKTQPRMIRRNIMSMSVAEERHVYLFPDSVPVNLSNEKDLKRLRELLPHKELYVVVGSDVPVNASSYRGPSSEASIHSFNHIIFRRESSPDRKYEEKQIKEAYGNIKGRVVELKLPVHLEDISSSRIRENIDYNRTEVLAACLRDHYGYAVYHRRQNGPLKGRVLKALERQGFLRAPAREDMHIYTVNMEAPISLLQNMETTIKDQLNRNERILAVMDRAHRNLQMALTELYPGNLVISFNAGVLHHKMVKMITIENQVPAEPRPERHLGPYMCVPFGKILRVAAVPNTVTKTLHTDKVFEPDIKNFRIAEYPNYSPLINQIRTIKSFDRSVILVDDLLHKGYRIRELDPLFKAENITIRKLVVGILSGRGKDLMTIQKRKVDCVYFIPNLRAWFVESSLYPFIGGDSVARKEKQNVSMIPSINLIQPYVAPAFLAGAGKESIYNLSLTCLENAWEILTVLEEEY